MSVTLNVDLDPSALIEAAVYLLGLNVNFTKEEFILAKGYSISDEYYKVPEYQDAIIRANNDYTKKRFKKPKIALLRSPLKLADDFNKTNQLISMNQLNPTNQLNDLTQSNHSMLADNKGEKSEVSQNKTDDIYNLFVEFMKKAKFSDNYTTPSCELSHCFNLFANKPVSHNRALPALMKKYLDNNPNLNVYKRQTNKGIVYSGFRIIRNYKGEPSISNQDENSIRNNEDQIDTSDTTSTTLDANATSQNYNKLSTTNISSSTISGTNYGDSYNNTNNSVINFKSLLEYNSESVNTNHDVDEIKPTNPKYNLYYLSNNINNSSIKTNNLTVTSTKPSSSVSDPILDSITALRNNIKPTLNIIDQSPNIQLIKNDLINPNAGIDGQKNVTEQMNFSESFNISNRIAPLIISNKSLPNFPTTPNMNIERTGTTKASNIPKYRK